MNDVDVLARQISELQDRCCHGVFRQLVAERSAPISASSCRPSTPASRLHFRTRAHESTAPEARSARSSATCSERVEPLGSRPSGATSATRERAVRLSGRSADALRSCRRAWPRKAQVGALERLLDAFAAPIRVTPARRSRRPACPCAEQAAVSERCRRVSTLALCSRSAAAAPRNSRRRSGPRGRRTQRLAHDRGERLHDLSPALWPSSSLRRLKLSMSSSRRQLAAVALEPTRSSSNACISPRRLAILSAAVETSSGEATHLVFELRHALGETGRLAVLSAGAPASAAPASARPASATISRTRRSGFERIRSSITAA